MALQVLIAGAGPVGLTMAAELARYGVMVRIIDKAAQRTDKSKALVLWSRTMELLDRTGASEHFIAAGNKVIAANIIAGKKQIARVDLEGVDSPYPFALMLPQSETERLLDEHLARCGVSVERQTELLSFSSGADGVSARLRRRDGSEETVQADWLIGCDGAHSVVRHGSGLSFPGSTLQTDWVLADVHLQAYPFAENEIATYWHEDGVLAVFPISPGRFRVIADIGLSAGGPPPTPTLEQIQEVIDRRGPGGMRAIDPIWISAFRINERKVSDYRAGAGAGAGAGSGRVFLAGDAAHVHSPAGGQGMNTGMQDAFNLAWKLALVCHGTCLADLLDSYSVERSAIGDQVLRAAGRLTEVATLKNHIGQHIRNVVGHFLLGLAPVQKRMTETMTEISIGYKDSPLNGPARHAMKTGAAAGLAPGMRMKPIPGQTPIGAGAAPRFALFAAASGETTRLLLRFQDLLEPAARPPLDADTLCLVRPDGYVACVAAIGDVDAIGAYLQRISNPGKRTP